MLLAALFFLSFLETTFNNNPAGTSITSLSWTGYTVTKGFAQLQVVAITASWVVPQVNVSSGDGYSSAWIGIGGQLDKTLIQVGTEHNVVNGQATYDVWYELLPAFAVTVSNVTIAAGDTIVASLTLLDAAVNQWNIKISDTTNGLTFDQNFVYNSTLSSGEWIVERPTINGQVTNLADFGSVTFTDCGIQANSTTGSISNFSYSRIQMVNQQAAQLASAASLGNDGSSFAVFYVKGS